MSSFSALPCQRPELDGPRARGEPVVFGILAAATPRQGCIGAGANLSSIGPAWWEVTSGTVAGPEMGGKDRGLAIRGTGPAPVVARCFRRFVVMFVEVAWRRGAHERPYGCQASRMRPAVEPGTLPELDHIVDCERVKSSSGKAPPVLRRACRRGVMNSRIRAIKLAQLLAPSSLNSSSR